MILNYGNGYCAFAHNICGSQTVVPDRMLDTSKPLSPEFFINPRWPPSVVLTEAATIDVRLGEAMIAPKREVLAAVLGMNISDVDEHLSTTKVGLDNELDFST